MPVNLSAKIQSKRRSNCQSNCQSDVCFMRFEKAMGSDNAGGKSLVPMDQLHLCGGKINLAGAGVFALLINMTRIFSASCYKFFFHMVLSDYIMSECVVRSCYKWYVPEEYNTRN